jgi:hypothetical protein
MFLNKLQKSAFCLTAIRGINFFPDSLPSSIMFEKPMTKKEEREEIDKGGYRTIRTAIKISFTAIFVIVIYKEENLIDGVQKRAVYPEI